MKKNMSGKDPQMMIRMGNIHDLPEMRKLFEETITEVCRKDYTPEQLEAWKSGAENEERWQKVIREQIVFITESEGVITGFATLDKGNYIDLLFVHKDFQHQGIASLLYGQLEFEAIKQQQLYITAHVSKTARPFFEKSGFTVLQEQSVPLRGTVLTNYKMEKKLIGS
jgi:putative acetyltransferase